MPYPTPSNLRRLLVWPLLAAVWTLPLRAAERNAWPFWVGQEDPASGQVTSAQALGPLLAERRLPDGTLQQAARPLWLGETRGKKETHHFLYPVLTWQRDGDYSFFSFFQLINDRRSTDARGVPQRGFDVWPFYFSRDTGDAATSYRALLPIAGTIKQRFGSDELSWVAFPFYFRTEAKGRITHYTPWPFVRRLSGAGHHGVELWPLAGERGRAGDYRAQFYLWPLVYKQERNLSDPVPTVSLGALPFYTRDTGPGLVQENFLWPFFGYTDRTEPQRYHETRYLWPFFVQGRGDERFVNRWAPFYSHSVVKGYDKTWIFFPLGRSARWQADGVAHERDQFLWFLYWNHEQRSLANPAAAPARKTHLWPLVSEWDNGAGRYQVQLLSPFEVFFPNNEPIRQLYSPLFAVYRYDRRAADDVRWTVLWGLLSRARTPATSEFHLGPLYSTRRDATGERIALGAGLFAWRRAAGESRWRFSLFDFRSTPADSGPAAALP